VGFVHEVVRAHAPLAERNRIMLRFHAGLDALVISLAKIRAAFGMNPAFSVRIVHFRAIPR
jgi:hypothetical protein